MAAFVKRVSSYNCESHCSVVVISVLTLEVNDSIYDTVYLCKAFGLVVKLVCAGSCGIGSEGELFTCGGCGEETAQGVDCGTSSRSVSCGGAV